MAGNGKKLRLLIVAVLTIATVAAGAYPLLLYATDVPTVSECGYTWTIKKTADHNEVILSLGQHLQVNYTITVNASLADGCNSSIDECVRVYDNYLGAYFPGVICAEDETKTLTYSRLIGPYNECGVYEICNTAYVLTTDTHTQTVTGNWFFVYVPCDDGCTLTPGYWKTHSEYGPAPYDNTWALVDPNGEDSEFFDTGQSWYQVLWTEPQGGNAYYILAHAYIAGVLNELNGASVPAEVESAMDEAEALLDEYDGNPESMEELKGKGAREIRQDFIDTAELLDDYNNGLIGPGHCTE
jgi:hypothetical protein